MIRSNQEQLAEDLLSCIQHSQTAKSEAKYTRKDKDEQLTSTKCNDATQHDEPTEKSLYRKDEQSRSATSPQLTRTNKQNQHHYAIKAVISKP